MTPAHDSPDPSPFRWQTLFQQASEPLFLLNRRRRILFVNRAWEVLTGLSLAEVKGQTCRRRPRGILAENAELVLGALAPPPEVAQGQPARARRLMSLGSVPACWHVDFFPLAAVDGPVAVLGKITVLPRPEPVGGQPLSEKMLALRQRHADYFRLDGLIGNGPAVSRLREQIRLAAQTRLPVLFVGPPGSGKRWAARSVHQLSPDREQTFIGLDCARLAPNLLAELLLTAAQPSRTVYLDSVARLPRDLQERLIQRLDTLEGPRLFAGIEQDPLQSVRSGTLLHDLYCRLSALVLELPPLHERMDDFSGWVELFLPRANRAAERSVRGLSADAEQLLRAYAWPRNLGELYEVLVLACLRAKGDTIESGDLPFHLRHGPLPAQKPLALDAILAEVERRLIVQALRLAKNNKSRAADLLTIWRARLLRRMENLGIKEENASADSGAQAP
jgi:transcriptional regulator with PAS, ATPase and Fis domain